VDRGACNEVKRGKYNELMTKPTLLTILCAALLFLAVSSVGYACRPVTYWPEPLCASYGRATRVFTGKVKSIERLGSGEVMVEFDVYETIKGKRSSTATTFYLGGSCELPVKLGEEYLIFGDGPSLDVQQYGGTVPLKDAEKTIDYIRDLATTEHESISGFVVGLSEDDAESVRVAISGPRGERETHPSSIGFYEFEDVGPGEFSVKLEVPFWIVMDSSEKAEILPGRKASLISYDIVVRGGHCDHREIQFGRYREPEEPGTATLKGKQIDALGKPVEGKFPELFPIDSAGSIHPNTGLLATTDANGNFIFEKLRPGRYVLSIDKFVGSGPTTSSKKYFYPNVETAEKARVIELTDKATLELGVFVDPPGR
jgi:hypothetical protein